LQCRRSLQKQIDSVNQGNRTKGRVSIYKACGLLCSAAARRLEDADPVLEKYRAKTGEMKFVKTTCAPLSKSVLGTNYITYAVCGRASHRTKMNLKV
jgi:hypothetical protein